MQALGKIGSLQVCSALCNHCMDLRTRSLPRECTDAGKEKEPTWEDHCGLLLCTLHKKACTVSNSVMAFHSLFNVETFVLAQLVPEL